MSLNYRNLASNASIAFISQGISMTLSAVTALIVPKVLGVEEFGYWQLFMFYSTYVGFFHLGLNDGIYLINGGIPRERLDKKSINSQFWFSLLFQSVFALAIAIIAFFGPFNENRQFVILFTALFLLLNNLSNFLGFLFQAMNETKLYSFSIMVDRLIFLIPLSAFLIFRCQSFKLYIVAYAFSKTCCLIYCCYNARDILTSGLTNAKTTVQNSIAAIRVGFKLTIANIASMLILGIARLLIDANWGIKVFGEVSFSLSIVTFFLTFVSQASLVLFPALRQIDTVELQGFFTNIRNFMSLVFPLLYLVYYPIIWLIRLWLPQYSDTLYYFAFLLPICIFDSRMDICCTTYLKVLRKETLLLWINICTVIVSAIGALIGTYYLHSIEIILICAVFAIFLRSFVSEIILCRLMKVPYSPLFLEELAITIVFIALAAMSKNNLRNFTITVISLLIYYICNRSIAHRLYINIKLQVLHR
ncbi:MAG: oligosaccharide flippase family protein [Bifidobacterium sp.]|nr:oligosaccharide flippase family protein [Bifidobacterium sp.]